MTLEIEKLTDYNGFLGTVIPECQRKNAIFGSSGMAIAKVRLPEKRDNQKNDMRKVSL